jgi:hypothetical protein
MVLMIFVLIACAMALAQQTPGIGTAQSKASGTAAGDFLSGKYEGTAKTAGAADTQLSLELKNDGGKVSGYLVSTQETINISEGSIADGKLALKFGDQGKDGTLTARVEGEKITGDWLAGAQKRAVELKKVTTASAAMTPANPISLSGDWDAVADNQGQPFAFALTLKVDGEKVTGSSSSQLGESTISIGNWKDGKLSFQLESANGVVTMNATLVEGKLTGEFDFAGQLQGKWVAIKKQ